MSLTPTPESKEKLPERPMKKEEREDKKQSPKREDCQLTKRRSLEKEKLTAKNGSRLSETTFLNLPKRVSKKTSPSRNWKDKSNDDTTI